MNPVTAKKATFLSMESADYEALPGRTHHWYCRPDLVDTDKLNFVRARFEVGEYHHFHNHPGMEEILYILSGKAEQWLESEKRILGPGDAVHIPKGIVHATFNAGDEVLDFLALLTPADAQGPMTVDRSQEEPWKRLRPI